MKHSLIFTTIRPHCVAGVMARWTRMARRPENIQWCITTDAVYEKEVLEEIKSRIAATPADVRFGTQRVPPFCCNKAWNAAAKLSDGDFLYLVPDDLYPPLHWDEAVERKFERAALRASGVEMVLHTDDSTEAKMLTHPIVTREWYEKMGYLMPPVYMSMFDDTELGEVALARNAVVPALDLKFEHRHPAYGKRPFDEHDEKQSGPSRMEASRILFQWRKAHGFPPIIMERPKSHGDYAAYLQVNKDDFCLTETCTALLEQGVRRFFFHFQLRSWSGRLSSEGDESAVRIEARRLREVLGCETVVEYCSMTPHPGEKRVDTETRVRNEALRSMRARGWLFALFVDGDEIWRRGSVARVHEIASDGWDAVQARTVIIAGLPGYPVDARDNPTIYVGPNAWFHWCRNTTIQPHIIEDRLTLHFSATRRTREAIVEKHRESGHYDDPEYHMETWCRETMPKIKAGMKNVHMYNKGELWPLVRKFTSAEWDDVPKSLRKYLAKP